MPRLLLSSLVLLAAYMAPGSQVVNACSFALPELFVLDPEPDGTDVTAPATPEATATVSTHDGSVGCGGVDSCDGETTLTIRVATSDDVTPLAEIGFEVTPREGAPPLPLEGAVTALYVDADGSAVLAVPYNAGATGEGRLEITAIDAAGNRSETISITIERVGGGGGCQVGSGASLAASLFIAALLRPRRAGRRRGGPSPRACAGATRSRPDRGPARQLPARLDGGSHEDSGSAGRITTS